MLFMPLTSCAVNDSMQLATEIIGMTLALGGGWCR